MECVMVDKKGPHFPAPLASPADPQFKAILDREVDVAKELGYVYDAITLTRQKLQGRVPLIGFVGAPWTLFAYMVEGGGSKIYKDVKTWIYKHPAESKAILDKLTTVCVEHLALQVKGGAQMVQVFDSNAGELSPLSFKSFSLPYLTRIADELPARLAALGLEAVPMTVFAKGAWYALPALCETKYDVISLDWLHDPAESYRVARAKGKTLQGNADPGVLYGGREAITMVVEEMVRGFEGGKQGWIANLGHGMNCL
jgi:uroporphyrinogen decarboxylase